MNADQIWRAIESRVLRAIQGYKPSSLVTFPVPVSYTPVWAATGTQPSIGDGTLVGRYALRGKMCSGVIRFVAGSGTSFGSGTWSFSLPFPSANNGMHWVGQAFIRDVGIATYNAFIDIGPGLTAIATFAQMTGNEYTLSPTTPFTWANTDIAFMQFEYEIE
jgi:hypothetical protein